MEIEEVSNKNSDSKIENIFDNISEDLKNTIKNCYIYNENKLIGIANDYIKSFQNFEIYVDDKLTYSKYEGIVDEKNIQKTYIKNPDYSFKDSNLLIIQEKENAEVYDLCYLFGPNNNKVFLGFQMKSYRDLENNKYKNYKLDKESVIKKSRQLLVNTKYLLDIEITEWHYFVVGIYFDQNDMKKFSLNNSYSENLIDFCYKNELELILYNPINEKFYDSNKNIINELQPTKLSKIGGEIIPIFKFEEKNDFLGRKRMNERYLEFAELIKDLNDNKINVKINERKIPNYISSIKNHFGLKEIKFIGKKIYNENCDFVPIPNDNYFLMFKKKKPKNEKGLNKFYIFIKYNSKSPYVYDFKEDKDTKYDFDIEYFHLFDLNKYYYVFAFK